MKIKKQRPLKVTLLKMIGLGCLSLGLIACSTPMTPAPVKEQYGRTKKSPPTIVLSPKTIITNNTVHRVIKATTPSTMTQDGSNTYTVRQGDTLYSIALDNGVSYRDLVQWNNITDPNYIQADQVLYLNMPTGLNAVNNSNNTVATSIPVPVISTQPTQITVNPTHSTVPTVNKDNGITSASNPNPNSNSNSSAIPVNVADNTTTTTVNKSNNPTNATNTTIKPATATIGSDITWQIPNTGKIIATYSEGKNKGIDIAGNQGDSIVAAADGKVVYAGSALKGYGKIVIIKHNEIYLSAYAHNSKLLVKEDSLVKRGQKIAEMGNTDTDDGRVKLHFEIRKYGKPIDPRKLLPF